MSLGRPQFTRSSSSFAVSVGRSTTTPGRFTFFRSLCAAHANHVLTGHDGADAWARSLLRLVCQEPGLRHC